MSLLKDYNVVRNEGVASNIFEGLFDDIPFTDIPYSTPSEYVRTYWEKYLVSPNRSASVNGNMFELIMATLFIRENILPLYLQAKVAFVPNVEYDAILYCREFGSIGLSLKTSLRERYKQADLEAIALKYVHRRAKSFLLTLDKRESEMVNRKIKSGDVIGLNKSVYCASSELDELFSNLKEMEFEQAGVVPIIESNLIVTSQKINNNE